MKTRDPEPAELNISPEKVSYIILKAREFDAKVEPVDAEPESSPADEGEREILEDFASDATASELRQAIADLDDDEVVDLIAMAWVGRGDFDASDFAEARSLASERHRRNSARYLMGIPDLGDVLEEGLATLGGSFDEDVTAHL